MINKTIQRNHMFAIFALLLMDALFAYPEYRIEGWLLYLMSEVLFSFLQFKFAQCHTWVMKQKQNIQNW